MELKCGHCGGELVKDTSVQYLGFICKECGKYKDLDMERSKKNE